MTTVLTAAGLGDRAVRIGDEVDRLLRIVSALRQVVEAEVNANLSGPNPGIMKGTLTQVKDLTSAMNSLVDSKIRLDKTAKQLAENMTPDDEEAAVRTWVRALDPKKRVSFLQGELAWHGTNV